MKFKDTGYDLDRLVEYWKWVEGVLKNAGMEIESFTDDELEKVSRFLDKDEKNADAGLIESFVEDCLCEN